MSIVVRQLLDASSRGRYAVVEHHGELLRAEVVGTCHAIEAAVGVPLCAELDFLSVESCLVKSESSPEQHGLFQCPDGRVRVVGAVHSIIPVDDSDSILDIYLQRGPEFLALESSAIPGPPPTVGDTVEVIVTGLTFFPAWT